jgi:single-strand DNA-binding protein
MWTPGICPLPSHEGIRVDIKDRDASIFRSLHQSLGNVTSFEKAVKVSIATDRIWTNDAGTKETRTDWITVTVFDDQAAWIKDNVSKGQPVIAEGRINNSSYEKDEQTVYTTDLVATTFNAFQVANANAKD